MNKGRYTAAAASVFRVLFCALTLTWWLSIAWKTCSGYCPGLSLEYPARPLVAVEDVRVQQMVKVAVDGWCSD